MNLTARRLAPVLTSFFIINISAAAQGTAPAAGYTDAPYLRYEAEPGRCSGNAEFLTPPQPYSQAPLQAEASNQTAAILRDRGDRVEWTADADADAMTVRFSIPDGSDGKGSKASLALYVNGSRLTDIALDSYWAWQYIPVSNGTKHPDNTPADNKFARMRFDEVHVLLPAAAIRRGDTFALVKDDDGAEACTIDFVELEKVPQAVTFDELPEPKVEYTGDGSTLQAFINSNGGKTIYLPEGDYTLGRRLQITAGGTKITGAGMWRTRLYFSAAPDNRRTYANRGIESDADGIVLQGFSMNTAANRRYFDNNESMGTGKGLQGSFGRNSVVRDLRIEHFECGAWIADYAGKASDGLLIENCRIRNNYADGINLCSGTVNATVRNCSLRNNGDDDLASWSTGNLTQNIEFARCTAEHNWRASSLAFFGGRGHRAHHIAIADGLESGVRVTADFQGTGFAADSRITLSDITVERCGCVTGTQGEQGDFWGNGKPSVLVQAGYWYDIDNLTIERLTVRDSRSHGMSLLAQGGKKINNLELHSVHIDGTPVEAWGIQIGTNVTGSGHYSGLTFNNVTSPEMSNIPVRFDFTETEAGITDATAMPALRATATPDGITICGALTGKTMTVYDSAGTTVARLRCDADTASLALSRGFYIIRADGHAPTTIMR